MQENEFLHDVFGFTPKKKLPGVEHRVSGAEKVACLASMKYFNFYCFRSNIICLLKFLRSLRKTSNILKRKSICLNYHLSLA